MMTAFTSKMISTMFSVNNTEFELVTDEVQAELLQKDDAYTRSYLQELINGGKLMYAGFQPNDKMKTWVRNPSRARVANESISDQCTTFSIDSLRVDAGSGDLQCNGTKSSMAIANEENSSGQDVADGPGANWTRASTMILISTRGNMEREFSTGSTKHYKLWTNVASSINVSGDFKFTGKQCHEKWRNLVHTYKKNQDKMKKNGGRGVKWEYFQAMDEAKCKIHAITPPTEPYVSSLTPMLMTPANNVSTPVDVLSSTPKHAKHSVPYPKPVSPSTSSSSHEPELTTVKKMQKRKRKLTATSEPPQWFVEYLEKQEMQNLSWERTVKQMWEEQKKMEAVRLEMMENLLGVLTKK